MSYDLKDQVAIVTGAAGDIGSATCRALLNCGARVLAIGRRAGPLQKLCASLTPPDGRLLTLTTDVSKEADVATVFEQVRKDWGRLDLLVNNAGIMGPTAPVADIARDDWDEVMAINLTGPFLCAREAVRMMAPAGRGKIINISSVAGKNGYPLRSPYCASKWGLIGLTITLAQEYGPSNIQVNAICPGPVAGDRIERVMAQRAKTRGVPLEEMRQQYANMTALNRFVRPEDIADMICYLASPAGDNITAQVLEISAGFGVSAR